RVLTMEFINGKKITDVGPLRLTELDTTVLAEELFRAYLKQILIDGFFHADPHPGNVFITEDDDIALLDLGMVSHISANFREKLLRLMLANSEGRGDEAAEAAMRIGDPRPSFDKNEYFQRVANFVTQNADRTVDRLDAG